MELPPSNVDPDDFPSGPTGMARYLEARIDELEGRKIDGRCREERRPINKQIHACRGMLRRCKTRAGYVDSSAEVALLDADELPEA